MEAYDFLLNKNNDLEFENNDITYTKTDVSTLRQRLSITLQTWMGEWFLNTSFGIPYRQKLMAKGITKEEVDAEFIAAINSYPEIVSIISFKSDISRINRSYTLAFYVQTVYGKQRFTVSLGKTHEPVNSITIGEPCPYGSLDSSNTSDYYKLINIDLPNDIPWA